MARLRFDAVKGALNAALDTPTTTISSPGLARLGNVASPDTALICLYSTDANGNIVFSENVYVISHTAGAVTATITRAGDGTSARSWPIGTNWTHGLGVADVADIEANSTNSVTTFNTRSGAVTLSKADVTGTGLTYSDVGADASGAATTAQSAAQTYADRYAGSAAGTTSRPLAATDSTVTNSRTPTSHAATHAAAGTDPVAISASQVSGLPSSLPPNGAAGAGGGDLAGSYPNPTLAAAGTAGTYTKITTDSKGRVTSGTTLSATDVPTVAAGATGALSATDASVTNARTPSTHASTHGQGGTDALTTIPSAVTGTTQTAGDSSTKIATTAFVTGAVTSEATARDTAITNAKGLPIGLTGATSATRFVGGTTSGAPASGTFAVGDFVVDRTAAIWICTVAGTPGTWSAIGGSGGGTTAIANGGTGATTAATALSNLGAQPGTSQRSVFTTAGAYSGTAPAWANSAIIYLVGGGAGGGGGALSTTGFGAGGGGAAGTVIARTIPVTGGASYSGVVGAGGNGGAVSTNGSKGTNTTLTTTGALGVAFTANGGNYGYAAFSGSNGAGGFYGGFASTFGSTGATATGSGGSGSNTIAFACAPGPIPFGGSGGGGGYPQSGSVGGNGGYNGTTTNGASISNANSTTSGTVGNAGESSSSTSPGGCGGGGGGAAFTGGTAGAGGAGGTGSVVIVWQAS